MSNRIAEYEKYLPEAVRHELRRRSPARRSDYLGPHPGLVIAGVAAIGLGALAWYYLGPDIRRYIKISSM